jgi:hypothetical protein
MRLPSGVVGMWQCALVVLAALRPDRPSRRVSIALARSNTPGRFIATVSGLSVSSIDSKESFTGWFVRLRGKRGSWWIRLQMRPQIGQ